MTQLRFTLFFPWLTGLTGLPGLFLYYWVAVLYLGDMRQAITESAAPTTCTSDQASADSPVRYCLVAETSSIAAETP